MTARGYLAAARLALHLAERTYCAERGAGGETMAGSLATVGAARVVYQRAKRRAHDEAETARREGR